MTSRGASIALIALAVLALVGALVYYLRLPPDDFETYYGAALAVRDGGRLYERALIWREAGYAVSAPMTPPTQGTAFIYPPFLAVALVPLTWLPYQVAHALWGYGLLLCLAGVAVVLARELPTDPSDSAAAPRPWLQVAALASAVVLGLLVFQPMRASLTSKQVDVVLLLLLALSLAAFARRHDTQAGIWFGLAVAIKPFLVLLTLYFLWKGAYRLVVAAGLLSATLALGPFLFLGVGTFVDYVTGTGHFAGPVTAASPISQSIYSVLLRTFTENPYARPLVDAPWLVLPLRVALGGGAVILALVGVRRTRALPTTTLALEHGLVLAAGLLAIPLTENIHLTYLVIAIVAGLLAAGRCWSASGRARWLGAALAGLLIVLSLPGLRLFSHGFYHYYGGPLGYPLALSMSVYLVLLAGLAGVMLLMLRAQRRLDRDARAAA